MPHFKTVTVPFKTSTTCGLVEISERSKQVKQALLPVEYLEIQFTNQYIFASKLNSLEIYFYTGKPNAPLKKILQRKESAIPKILTTNAFILNDTDFYLLHEDTIVVEQEIEFVIEKNKHPKPEKKKYNIKTGNETIYVDDAYYFSLQDITEIDRFYDTPLFCITENGKKILSQNCNNHLSPILCDCEDIWVFWESNVIIYRKERELYYHPFIIPETDDTPIQMQDLINVTFSNFQPMASHKFLLKTQAGDYVIHNNKFIFDITFAAVTEYFSHTNDTAHYIICQTKDNDIYLAILLQDHILFADKIENYQIHLLNNITFTYHDEMHLFYDSKIFSGYSSIIPYMETGFLLTKSSSNDTAKQLIAVQNHSSLSPILVDCNADIILDFALYSANFISIVAKVGNCIQIGIYCIEQESYSIYKEIDDMRAYEIEDILPLQSNSIPSYRMLYCQDKNPNITKQLFWQEDLFLLLEKNENVIQVVHPLRHSSYYCIIEKEGSYKLIEKSLDHIIKYDSGYQYDNIELLQVEHFHKKQYTIFLMSKNGKQAITLFRKDIFQFVTNYYHHMIPHESHLSFEIGNETHVGTLDIFNQPMIPIKFDSIEMEVLEDVQIAFYIATLKENKFLFTEYGVQLLPQPSSKNQCSKIKLTKRDKYMIIVNYTINNMKKKTSLTIFEYKEKLVPSVIRAQTTFPINNLKQLNITVVNTKVRIYLDDNNYFFYSTDFHKDYIFVVPRKMLNIHSLVNVGSGCIEQLIIQHCKKAICLYTASIHSVNAMIEFFRINEKDLQLKKIFDKNFFTLHGYRVEVNRQEVVISKDGNKQYFSLDELLKVGLKYVLKKDCDAS